MSFLSRETDSSCGLIPKPLEFNSMPGVFMLTPDARIVATDLLHAEAELLAEQLRQATGFACMVAGKVAPDAPSIQFALDPGLSFLGNEGYELKITPRLVLIQAAAPAGAFYAAQTLLQMFPTAIFSRHTLVRDDWAVPCGEITDTPRFSWRGAMLDPSRHFLPMEFVLKFIDLMALHKLNRLHLHLNDDQGWRLEIKRYPKLTTIGSHREKTLIGFAQQSPADTDFDAGKQPYDDLPYGGFYTQDEARAIVAYAAERHMIVVPEIEIPGHAQAAIAAYPELGCTSDAPKVSPHWGIHDQIFNPSDQTIEFLQNVLMEVMDIFPSPFIHTGGDEAVKKQWKASDAVQARIRELGLKDEAEMQSYVISRMDAFLADHGRRLVGWDEILEGGLAPGAVVMSWRGEQGGIEAAEAGHDVIMAPYQSTYLDYYQSEDRASEPQAFPDYLPLETVYAYEPVPADLPEKFAPHVLGAQCQLWSEYMPSSEQVEYQAFPRLCALAEVTWSAREHKNYANFLARLETHLERLDMLGVHYRHRKDSEIRYAVYRVE